MCVCFLKSLANENDDLKWMWAVELARSSRHQNLEIIYNNNRVYFKTVRAIRKHEPLAAYPSKDLEISLGIQFIPMHPGSISNQPTNLSLSLSLLTSNQIADNNPALFYFV